MPQDRVTIQQIANHLRLSKFSVSRALSGKDGVGDETRARVLSAAHHLGYRRQPETPFTRQVLFVMHDEDGVSSEVWMTMLHGAEREAERGGIAVVPRQMRHLEDFKKLGPAVVGLVLATARPGAMLAAVRPTGLPVVCAGYVPALAPVDHVVGADWEAGVVVARFLTGLSHRSMGFVQGNEGLFGRTERLRGLRDGAQETPGTTVQNISFKEPGGFLDAFGALLKAGIAPTALFCAHDGLAVTVISELSRLGVRVPEDISVVGFFDFVSATQIVPQLTTVRVPQEQIGAAVVRCIAFRLSSADNRRFPPLRLTLTPEFIERRSTAIARAPTWLRRAAASLARASAL